MTPEELQARDAIVERVVAKFGWTTEMLSGSRIDIRNKTMKHVGRIEDDGSVTRIFHGRKAMMGAFAAAEISKAITAAGKQE